MAVTNNLYAYLVDALDAWNKNDIEKAKTVVANINGLELGEIEQSSVNDILNILNTDKSVESSGAYEYLISNISCIVDRDKKLHFAKGLSYLSGTAESAKQYINDEISSSTDFASYSSPQYCSLLIKICLAHNLYTELASLRNKFVC